MDFLVFFFYFTILFFFIVNTIINIYTIEKRFDVTKPPGLFKNLIDIKYQTKER